MSWKDKYGSAAGGGGGGGGLFVKLTNGEQIDFVVCPSAEPHESVTRWDDAENKSVKCSRTDEGAQVKILVAAYVVAKRGKGAKVNEPVGDVKIIKFSPRTFVDLCDAIDDEDVGGEDQVYRLKRTGDGLETRYAITRIDKASADVLRAANTADVPDMGRYGDPIGAKVSSGPAKPAAKVNGAAVTPASAEPDDFDVPF